MEEIGGACSAKCNRLRLLEYWERCGLAVKLDRQTIPQSEDDLSGGAPIAEKKIECRLFTLQICALRSAV